MAAVQSAPVYLDHEASLEKTIKLIGEAGKIGAEITGFEETWLPGYPFSAFSAPSQARRDAAQEYIGQAIEIPGLETGQLCAAARAFCDVVTPGSNEAATSRLFSSQDQRRRRSTDVITTTRDVVIGLLLGLLLEHETIAKFKHGGIHRRGTLVPKKDVLLYFERQEWGCSFLSKLVFPRAESYTGIMVAGIRPFNMILMWACALPRRTP